MRLWCTFDRRDGQHLGSNQVRAKIAVIAPHVDFGGGWVFDRSQHDDVASLEVEHAACIQCAIASSRSQWLYHGNGFVVHLNMDSSTGMVVKLCVDVVPSGGGHSQFSVLVLHAACKMAEWGTYRPVFYHCKVIKQGIEF